jgi:hypothetical protein
MRIVKSLATGDEIVARVAPACGVRKVGVFCAPQGILSIHRPNERGHFDDG